MNAIEDMRKKVKKKRESENVSAPVSVKPSISTQPSSSSVPDGIVSHLTSSIPGSTGTRSATNEMIKTLEAQKKKSAGAIPSTNMGYYDANGERRAAKEYSKVEFGFDHMDSETFRPFMNSLNIVHSLHGDENTKKLIDRIPKEFEKVKANRKEATRFRSILGGGYLFNANGDRVDPSTANPSEMINAINMIADPVERRKMADAFKEMTKNPSSRFYGVSLDSSFGYYQDNAQYTQSDYNDDYEFYSGLFYGDKAHMESSVDNRGNIIPSDLETYEEESRAIDESDDSAYVKSQRHYALDRAYGSIVMNQSVPESPESDKPDSDSVEDADSGKPVKPEKTEPRSPTDIHEVPGIIEETKELLAPKTPEAMSNAEMSAMLAPESPMPLPENGMPSGMQGPVQKTRFQQIADEYERNKGIGNIFLAAQEGDAGYLKPEDWRTFEKYADSPMVKPLLGVIDPEYNFRNEAANAGLMPQVDERRVYTQYGQIYSDLYEYIANENFPKKLRSDAYGVLIQSAYDFGKMIETGAYTPSQKLYTKPMQEFLESGTPEAEKMLADLMTVQASFDAYTQQQIEHRTLEQQETDQTVRNARENVLSGYYSDEEREIVLSNSNVNMRDVYKDNGKIRADYYVSGFFSPKKNGDPSDFDQSSVKAGLSANGVTDFGAYQIALGEMMREVVKEDTIIAHGFGLTLDEYYGGNANINSVAMRAANRISKQGHSITEEEAQILSTPYGNGIGMSKAIGMGAKAGYQSNKLSRNDAVVEGYNQIAKDYNADDMRLKYNSLYGPLFGASMYKMHMIKLLDEGGLDPTYEQEIRDALNSGGDPFEKVGINPEDFGIILGNSSELRRNLALNQQYIRKFGTQGENDAFNISSSVTNNALMALESSVATAVTGSPFLGFTYGYGIPKYGESFVKYLDQDFGRDTASWLAVLDTGMMTAANLATFSNIFGQVTGQSSSLLSGYLGAMMKNPASVAKTSASVAAFTFGEEFLKNQLGEVTDELKEGLGQAVIDRAFVPMFRKAESGEKLKPSDMLDSFVNVFKAVGDSPEILDETLASAGNIAINSALFSLVGASRSAMKDYKSVKALEALLDNANDSLADGVKKVGELVNALGEDVKDPNFRAEYDASVKQNQTDQEVAMRMATDNGEDGLLDKAAKADEQARSHEKAAKANAAALEKSKAIMDEADANINSGNFTEDDVQNYANGAEGVAKNKTGLEEHTREAEQKHQEADGYYEEKLNKTRTEVAVDSAKREAELEAQIKNEAEELFDLVVSDHIEKISNLKKQIDKIDRALDLLSKNSDSKKAQSRREHYQNEYDKAMEKRGELERKLAEENDKINSEVAGLDIGIIQGPRTETESISDRANALLADVDSALEDFEIVKDSDIGTEEADEVVLHLSDLSDDRKALALEVKSQMDEIYKSIAYGAQNDFDPLTVRMLRNRYNVLKELYTKLGEGKDIQEVLDFFEVGKPLKPAEPKPAEPRPINPELVLDENSPYEIDHADLENKQEGKKNPVREAVDAIDVLHSIGFTDDELSESYGNLFSVASEQKEKADKAKAEMDQLDRSFREMREWGYDSDVTAEIKSRYRAALADWNKYGRGEEPSAIVDRVRLGYLKEDLETVQANRAQAEKEADSYLLTSGDYSPDYLDNVTLQLLEYDETIEDLNEKINLIENGEQPETSEETVSESEKYENIEMEMEEDTRKQELEEKDYYDSLERQKRVDDLKETKVVMADLKKNKVYLNKSQEEDFLNVTGDKTLSIANKRFGGTKFTKKREGAVPLDGGLYAELSANSNGALKEDSLNPAEDVANYLVRRNELKSKVQKSAMDAPKPKTKKASQPKTSSDSTSKPKRKASKTDSKGRQYDIMDNGSTARNPQPYASKNPQETNPDMTKKPVAQSDGEAKVNPMESFRALADKLGVGEYFGAKVSTVPGSSTVPAGYYDPHSKGVVTSVRYASSVEVTGHEIGHAIAERIGVSGTQEMISNLPDRFSANYDEAQLADEAFAEFFWRYLVSDEMASEFAGSEYTAEFEQRLKDDGIYEDVKKSQEEVRQYLNADTGKKIGLMIKDKSEAKSIDLKDKMREIVTDTLDSTRPAEEVNDIIRNETGDKKVSAKENLRNAALMMATAPRRVWNMLTDSLTDVHGTIIGRGLRGRLADAGLDGADYNDFTRYMLALHSLDRDAQNKPVFDRASITQEETIKFINDMDAAHPEFVAAEKAFQEFRHDFLMEYMVKTGYLTEDALKQMEEMYPHYVPTMRVKNKVGSKHNSAKSYTIKKAKGSTEEIINPFDSFANMMNAVVEMNLRNEAAKTFDAAFRKYDGMEIFAREVGDTEIVIENDSENSESKNESDDQVPMIDGDDAITKAIQEHTTQQVKIKHNGITSKSSNGIVIQYPDGSQRFYEFRDQLLFDMLSGVRDSGKSAWDMVGNLTRMMTMLTTGSNPVFGIRNFMRDYQSSVNYGTWANSYVGGISKWAKAAYDVWKDKGDYKQYKALGGGGWTRVDTRTNRSTDEYRSAVFDGYGNSTLGGQIKNAGKKLWSAVTLEKVNETIEQASRYVEYKYGKHDLSTAEGRQEAYLAGQDVTVDFSRAGKGASVRQLKKVLPFFSANLQGDYRLARQFSDAEAENRNARFIKTVINTGIMSAIASGICLAYMDDEEKEEFIRMSDDMKAKHVFLPNFAPYAFGQSPLIRIPLEQDPLAYAVHALVTNTVWSGQGDELAIELAAIGQNIVSGLFPVGGTVADPVISMMTNKNWYGSSIVPAHLTREIEPNQFTPETPDAFVAMSNALYALNENLKISPMMLQYVFQQYTGFVGQIAIPALSKNKTTGRINGLRASLNAARKTITADPLKHNDVISSIYDNSDFLNTISAAGKSGKPLIMLNNTLSKRDAQKAVKEAEKLNRKGGAIYEAKAFVKDGMARIDAINSNPDLTAEEKYELESTIRRKIIEKCLDANEEVGKYRANYVDGESFFDRWMKAESTK